MRLPSLRHTLCVTLLPQLTTDIFITGGIPSHHHEFDEVNRRLRGDLGQKAVLRGIMLGQQHPGLQVGERMLHSNHIAIT